MVGLPPGQEQRSAALFNCLAAGEVRTGAGLVLQAEHFRLATTDPKLDPALFAGHSLRSGFVTSAGD